MYSIGVDLGDPTTSWARAVLDGTSAGGTSTDAQGFVTSAVGVGEGGALAIAPSDDGVRPTPSDVVRDFVGSLGSSEPVMVGGTPYGVESLVACVLAEVVAINERAVGSPADLVVVAHDDDLDPYRTSTLREAARIAGIAPDRLLLVPRSEAVAAAAPGATVAVAAARLGARALPDSQAGPSQPGGDIAAGAGGVVAGGAAGVAGAIGLGGAVADAGAVSAAGPTAASGLVADGASAGPGGASVGPAGSAVGPTGTSVGPGGASGVAGPVGSGPVGVGGSGAVGTGSSAFPWIPAAIGAAIAVVAVVVGVVVVAGGDDTPPEEAAAVVTTDAVVTESSSAIEPARSTVPVETAAITSAVETTVEPEPSTTLDPDIDLSAYIGDWVVCVPSPDAPNVSAAVEYSFTPSGPNQLVFDYVLLVYTDSSDCSTAGLPSNSATHTATVVGETMIDGVPAVQVTTDDNSFVMGVVGDTLQYGASTSPGSFPTAFDATQVYSRRS